MCWESRCSITGPPLCFDIDCSNIEVLRGTKLDAASEGVDTKRVSMGGLVGPLLILKTAYSAQSLHVGIETALTYKRKSRPDEEGILPNVRRCKNADKMRIGFQSETTPQISVAIDSETLDVRSTIIRYGEGKTRTHLYVT